MDIDDKERVREKVRFAELVSETVLLRPRGHDLWGCCPFHHEKSASFHINPETGLWKCFGCGRGGDVFAYIMEREHVDFSGAMHYLADKYGVELTQRTSRSHGPSRVRLYACVSAAEDFFHKRLLCDPAPAAKAARAYLSSRQMGSECAKSWRLGYAAHDSKLIDYLRAQGFTQQEILASDLGLMQGSYLRSRFFDRVIFPIHDELGKAIAFGGRVLGDAKPKYLNTKDTMLFHKGKHLFAFDRAKDSMIRTGTCIVCEGYTDVIAMHTHGFTNTVAALGTALTIDHIKLIERFATKRIICMFDGDAAGQKAALRSVQFIDKTKLSLECVVLPNNQDPFEFLSTHDSQALAQELKKASPLIQFVLNKTLKAYDMRVGGQRLRALSSAVELLLHIQNDILLKDMIALVANMCEVDIQSVAGMYEEKRKDMGKESSLSSFDSSSASALKDKTDAIPGALAPSASSAPSAHAADPSFPSFASVDARQQYACEAELLSLIVEHPTHLQRLRPELKEISWIDRDHEACAKAFLAAPADAEAKDLLARAEEATPTASYILSSASIPARSNLSTDEVFSFLMHSIKLFESQREITQIKTTLQLERQTLDPARTTELLERACVLQKHVQQLRSIIAKVI